MSIVRAIALHAIVALAPLAGCVGPTFIVQQYAGPVRPRETIATLRVEGHDDARIVILDDQDIAAPLESDARLHIEILPGRHTMVVASLRDPESHALLELDAQPGKVYRVALDGPSSARARAIEVAR